MQKIETVDMPRSEALASGQPTLGELRTSMHDDFRNRLIWGDNKLVMASLLKDFRGKIYSFRNEYIAHQEKELVDREVARQAMTDWILGLRRIWQA
jgi:hypothetical protein